MSSEDIEQASAVQKNDISLITSNKYRIVEVTVTVAVVVILWGLASIPTVIYCVRHYSSESNIIEVPKPELSTLCTQVPYKNGLCQSALLEAQTCILNSEFSAVNIISSEVDQDQSHSVIRQVSLLSPSPECEAVLAPFLCQYLFTLCDGDGKPYTPSSEECVNIRDKVCVDEWQTAVRFLGASQLPDCEAFPPQPICKGSANTSCEIDLKNETEASTTVNETKTLHQCSSSGDSSPVPNTTVIVNTSNTTSPLECKEDFIYNEKVHQCRPSCPQWTNHSHQVSQYLDIMYETLLVLSILASIAVLIVSCLTYKQMFKFPTVFIVYQTTDILIGAVTTLIAFTDRKTLFCSSEDWVEVLFNEPTTPYCTFSGIVLFYALWQLSLWCLFHIVAVFCGVRFPFRMRSFQKSPRAKYLYTALTLAGIFIPVIPVIIVTRISDFVAPRWPPVTCLSRSIDATFFAFILPITFLSAVGLTLMTFMLKKIIKGWRSFKRSTAVAKLLVLFCYITVLVMFNSATFSVITHNVTNRIQSILDYFICESTGVYPGKEECVISVNILNTVIGQISQVLLALYPISCLIYAINITNLKEKITLFYRYFFRIHT